ncbi:ABC transporter permease [Candidatus Gracilibacteria bacterium]|nr:ABC transporter permease [Candidatus Gracilibacteria bacterium]
MKLSYTIKTAVHALRSNKARTMLTILGIVIGITSIIIVMSIGQGAQTLILNQIEGLGAQTLYMEPGKEPTGPSDFTEVFSDSLKTRDYNTLVARKESLGLSDISPSVFQVAPISYETETIRKSVFGTGPNYLDVFEIYPEQGTYFSEDDVTQKSRVAIIGSEVKKKLFGESPALGERIKIKNQVFRIIGVLPQKGQVVFFNFDELVLIPYSTAQEYLLGINYFNAFLMRAKDGEDASLVKKRIQATLRELHNIEDPTKDDFHVNTQEDAVERVGLITGILTALLVSVAAISLIVGGIGIMNIMLVSVSERTPEIGLRKAVGARYKDILTQFLMEAVALTGLGGIVGILLGALFSLLIAVVLSQVVGLDWSFQFPISAAVIGIGVSGGIGLIFGLYPARQAARKSPIEALRYE